MRPDMAVGGEDGMSDREFWTEILRACGHFSKGLGTITAAITRRYALGERETATRPSERR
jgi:hypothetical protein